MRDFRGKRLDTGKWEYGKFVRNYLTKDDYCIADFGNTQKSIHGAVQVAPETIGQCTGIMGDFTDGKHKAGDLIKRSFIYEGDIVEPVLTDGTYQGFSWGRQVVVFDRGAFCLKDHRGNTTPLCNYAANVQLRVLGNIHDNPELLEVLE